MGRNRRRSKDAKERLEPYLSSEEMVALTGLGRRVLTSSMKYGVCSPYQDETGALGWTPGQIGMLRGMDALRATGMSDKQISDLASRGTEDFEAAVSEARMRMVRDDRRSAKRLMAERQAVADAVRVGRQRGFYLRYIPQRWLALLPQPKTCLLNSENQQQLFVALSDLSAHLGWAPTSMGGMLVGAHENAKSDRFVFLELCAQPLPVPSPAANADGGCYRAFGGSCSRPINRANCSLCAGYGAPITAKQELQWNTWSSAFPANELAVLACDLKRPYPCGPWSAHTRKQFPAQRKRERGTAFERLGLSPDDVPEAIAARPRLMPHEVKLPMGATACVLPAGFYLCSQCERADTEGALGEIMGMTHLMANRDMSVDDELRRICSLAAAMGDNVDWETFGSLGEGSDVIGGPDLIADPAQQGWWKKLDKQELAELTLVTETGILPDSDFTVVCADFFGGGPDELPLREVQLLVDLGEPNGSATSFASVLGGDGRKKMKGKRRLKPSHLAAAALLEHLPAGYRPAIRCRFCGATVEVDATASVVVCGYCGHAQAVPQLADEAKARSLKRIDDLRFEGLFDQAAGQLELECRDNPADADLHWLLMMCRYGVRYRRDAATGRYLPHIGAPIAVPIDQDPDVVAALEFADDAQWAVYDRQLTLLERARLEIVEGEIALGMHAHLA